MVHETSENNIGKLIRELRQKKGLSQKELANMIGCAPNTITEWEKRQGRSPGKKLLSQLTKALDISVDYLFGLEKTTKPQIPCYGDFSCTKFFWPSKQSIANFLAVTQDEAIPGCFCIKILDDILKPIILPNDYAIFDKAHPEDGDIVAVRFPERDNLGMIKRWRQTGKFVMLLDNNFQKVVSPQILHLHYKLPNKEAYVVNLSPKEHIIIEGKLIGIKRKLNNLVYWETM